jgi:hypothetical protein
MDTISSDSIMSFADWLRESREDIRHHGKGGIKRMASKFISGGLRRIGKYIDYGQNPFKESWDVLIILDACRPDILSKIADEEDIDWIGDVETRYSTASASIEFIEKCLEPLPNEKRQSMGIVTGNPHTDKLDPDTFGVYRDVGTTGWEDKEEWLPPKPVTDAAISLWRDKNIDQMVVWYMQPHAPYPTLDTNDLPDRDVTWSQLEYARCNEVSNEELRKAYQDTLSRVLEEVDVLRQNLAAEDVILTADHAELLGEYGLYAHPKNVPIPLLKRVPWVSLNANDDWTRAPEAYEPTSAQDQDIEGRLKTLGYR